MAERSRAQTGILLVIACALVTGMLTVAAPVGTTPVAGAAVVHTSGTPTPVAARAGISPGSEILWESDADLNRDLDVMVTTGVTRISLDIDWNSIQDGGPDSWWWQATDRVVLAARARGLIVNGTLAYSPRWARPADCPADTTHCLPANVDDFARFARAAVQRYGAHAAEPSLRGAIEDWSIWNEPNSVEFAPPRPDPVHYTAMLEAAYAAIKAEDPSATVVTGGTSPAGDAPDGSEISPTTWLALLYLNGARGSFDAVGHHPYSFPTDPLEAHPWNAFSQTLDLHNVMVFFGDGTKKIWGTEAGAPTGTDQVALTDTQQAQFVRDYYQGWNTTFASFTGPLFWFSHRDSGTNPTHWWENLGLLRNDWSPKPSYAAFQSVMRTNTAYVMAATGVRSAANPNGGFYVLTDRGAVTAYGSAPFYGGVRFAGPWARGLAVMPDGRGYVILDAFGGVHRFGSARQGPVGRARLPYWPGWDIARDVAISPTGRGIAVLDAFGGLHRAGDVRAMAAGYWPGWDIARSLAISPSGNGVYVLDGFGGVHTAGDAVTRRGPYWRGWDIARDLTVSPSGRGYTILDGFGGIHATGDARRPGANPAYAGRDHARGIALTGTSYTVAG